MVNLESSLILSLIFLTFSGRILLHFFQRQIHRCALLIINDNKDCFNIHVIKNHIYDFVILYFNSYLYFKSKIIIAKNAIFIPLD